MIRTIIIILVFLAPMISQAKKKVIYRKTQEVNFNETDIDGVVRNPDGAYLHQKKGVKFFPMYKVRERFNREITNSVEYLR